MHARTWLVIVMALVIAGCGSSSSTSSDEIERLEERVQQAEREAEAAQAAADDARQGGEPAENSEEPVEDQPVEEEEAEDTTGCINVPNVVGKDHQLAQDTMQAAGLYMLMEEDASGQGRLLLLDRNWTTVRQRPKAGECVDEGTEIMLYAVKDGER